MLLHLAVVENDHPRVPVVLLLHLVLGVDALPLDLGTVQGHLANPSPTAIPRRRQRTNDILITAGDQSQGATNEAAGQRQWRALQTSPPRVFG